MNKKTKIKLQNQGYTLSQIKKIETYTRANNELEKLTEKVNKLRNEILDFKLTLKA